MKDNLIDFSQGSDRKPTYLIIIGVIMGSSAPSPEYTGIDKYPGWIATIITIAISSIFLGALYIGANSHHGEHGEETPSEEAH